jgi:hypothetical protein
MVARDGIEPPTRGFSIIHVPGNHYKCPTMYNSVVLKYANSPQKIFNDLCNIIFRFAPNAQDTDSLFVAHQK